MYKTGKGGIPGTICEGSDVTTNSRRVRWGIGGIRKRAPPPMPSGPPLKLMVEQPCRLREVCGLGTVERAQGAWGRLVGCDRAAL